MYIKQVVIEGFKSYKKQVDTEAFSSKVNCVVGANGSGKSNFFHAIRFVLSDLYQNLRGEERHALLHIIEVVNYLDERLKELDEEKEDLRKYQQLDRQKKSLEYAIYDEKLKDARQKLAKVKEEVDKISKTSTDMNNKVLEFEEKRNDLNKNFKRRTKEHQVLSKEKASVEKRRTDAIQRRTLLELDCGDLKERILRSSHAKNGAADQLEVVKQVIMESRNELDHIKPSYDALKIQEDQMTKGIMEHEKKLSILYQKQGRATQFSSKAALDQWLQKEINELDRVLSSNLSQEQKLQGKIDNLNSQLMDQDEFVKSLKASLVTLGNNINQSDDVFITSKGQRDKLHDEQKLLWERENELSSEIKALKSEMMKAEKNLDHATLV